MLVGFDGSEESYKAFDFALELATSCKVPAPEIFVLSVIRPPEGLNLVDKNSLIDEATQQFKEQFKDLEGKAGASNFKISSEIAVGHPADTIIKYARNMDCPMVIVGHKGRSKIAGFLLGSVSRHVATMAHCTVVIVRKD